MGEPSSHRRAHSDPLHGVQDSGAALQPILSFIDNFKQLVDSENFGRVRNIGQEYTELKQETKVLRDNFQEAEQDWKKTTQHTLASHQDAVEALKNAHRITKAQLETTREENVQRQAEIKKLHDTNRDMQNLSSDLARSRKDVDDLLRKVKSQDDSLQKNSEALKTHEKVISDQSKDIKKLQADSDELHRIKQYVVEPIDNDAKQVGVEFKNLWTRCFELVQGCFQADLTDTVLMSQTAWRPLKECHQVTHSVPLVPSNSPAAKNTRTLVVMAIISETLTHEIFTTTHLVAEDEHLRDSLLRLASSSPEQSKKENFLRRAFASLVDDAQREIHITDAVVRIHGLVRDLLAHDAADQFHAGLLSILKDAARCWKAAQARTSRTEIDLRIDIEGSGNWKWKTFTQQGPHSKLMERDASTTEFVKDEVELVVLPRVYMVGPNTDQLLVPGRVFQRSAAEAMKKETTQADAAAKAGFQASSYIPSRPRRSATDQALLKNSTTPSANGHERFLG